MLDIILLIDDLLFWTIIVMLVFYFFIKKELQMNRQFNYAFMGALGGLGILEVMIGLTFRDISFLLFGALWLFFAYQLYKKAKGLS